MLSWSVKPLFHLSCRLQSCCYVVCTVGKSQPEGKIEEKEKSVKDEKSIGNKSAKGG